MTVIATAARSAIATTSEQAIFYLWDSPEAIRELAGPREIGLRFQPAVAGDLIGIRFWMPSQDTTPTVTVRAWTSGGAPLASKATTGFTAGGWVRVNLDTPVALTAGQVYVVSRNCELVGSICYVPDRDERLSSPITIGDLVALGDGFNGVLTAAGSSGVFPNLSSDDRSNLFVDPIFRRVDAVAAEVNFPVRVINAALALANRFTLLGGTALAAFGLDITRQSFRTEQRPAVNVALLGASGALALPAHTAAVDIDASVRDLTPGSIAQNPAFAVAQKVDTAWTTPIKALAFDIDLIGATGTAVNQVHAPAVGIDVSLRDAAAANVSQVPLFEMVRIQYDLTRRVGGNAVAETAVGGRTDWANDANVVNGTDGLHNGSPYATFDGNALGARLGRLDISYANSLDKTDLTITSVKLFFYYETTGTLLGNADLQLQWSKGGAVNTLKTVTGDENHLSTPDEFNITASITGWTDIDNLTTYYRADAALGETWHVDADAVEVEIIASFTQTP